MWTNHVCSMPSETTLHQTGCNPAKLLYSCCLLDIARKMHIQIRTCDGEKSEEAPVRYIVLVAVVNSRYELLHRQQEGSEQTSST